VLSQLGSNTVHLTQSGYRSEYFFSLADNDNLNIAAVPNSSPIRTCTTLISNRKNTVTEIVEESLPVGNNTENLVLDEYKKLLKTTNNVIISGSKASGFSNTIFPEMVKLAKDNTKAIILDYRGKDLINSIPYKPNYIKINFPEFVSTFFPQYSIGEHEVNNKLKGIVIKKIIELLKTFNVKTILTRGTMPVIYIDEKNQICEEKVNMVKPINTIGSGDAFTAGLAYRLDQKTSLQEAVLFSSECGSKNAALIKPGVIR